MLGDDPFDIYKAAIEKYIVVADKDQQRGAAELLAGMLSGKSPCYFKTVSTTYMTFQASKHWSVEKQTKIWNWLTPNIHMIFKQNIKTDTLPVWTSFLEVRMDEFCRPWFLKTFFSICFTTGIPEGYNR